MPEDLFHVDDKFSRDMVFFNLVSRDIQDAPDTLESLPEHTLYLPRELAETTKKHLEYQERALALEKVAAQLRAELASLSKK